MTETAHEVLGEGANVASGSSPDDVQIVDYFSFSARERFTLPDGKQWIEFEKMNEGAKKRYQDKTSKDLVLSRSGESRMSILQGSERHELIKACVVDWYMLRGGEPVPFNKVQLGDFLTLADPRIVEDLEKEIRKANPWLMADMKAEDIKKEIDNLTEMYEEALKREAGEGS